MEEEQHYPSDTFRSIGTNMTTINSTTSLSSPALVLEDGAETITQVIVHPVVLLHVLDHHTRRQVVSGRVIGTLLGRRDGKKVITTTNNV